MKKQSEKSILSKRLDLFSKLKSLKKRRGGEWTILRSKDS